MPWHCKNYGGYTTSTPVYNYPDADGIDNVTEIWSMLRTRGWTATAAAGLLTCIAYESGYNPWAWQNGIPSSSQVNYLPTSPHRAYGLVQWDPASYNNIYRNHYNKYIENPNAMNKAGYGPNFSDQPGSNLDGAAQIAYLDDFGWIGQYYVTPGYYETYGQMCPSFASFKSDTTHTPADLATVWVVNFERPTNPMNNKAGRDALAPELYNLISGIQPSGIPAWLLLKWRQNQIGGKGYI